MSASSPSHDTKALRLAAAKARIAFWTGWVGGAVTAEAQAYFTSRKRHWQQVANFIEMEP